MFSCRKLMAAMLVNDFAWVAVLPHS
jgi:hypothetical protein